MGNRQKHWLIEKNRGRELRKTEPDCKKPRKIGHSCMLRGLGLRTAHNHPPPIFNWINAAIPPGRKSHSSDPPASTDSPWSSNPAPVVSPADMYVKADHGMTPGRKGNALQSRGQIMCQEPILGTLMQESHVSVPDTFFFPRHWTTA